MSEDELATVIEEACLDARLLPVTLPEENFPIACVPVEVIGHAALQAIKDAGYQLAPPEAKVLVPVKAGELKEGQTAWRQEGVVDAAVLVSIPVSAYDETVYIEKEAQG